MSLTGDDSDGELSTKGQADHTFALPSHGGVAYNEESIASRDDDVALRTDPYDTSQDEFDSEEDDRENRFKGSSSTWRFFTEEERSLAASLDQQQASDLSIHLYNAHALKTGALDTEPTANSTSRLKKRKRARSDREASPSWLPDTAWTAWPMRPHLVPRRREQFGVPVQSIEEHNATYRKIEPWKPSADLEDEVKALILRKGKEQFQDEKAQDSTLEKFQMIVDDDQIDAVLGHAVQTTLSNFDKLLSGLQDGHRSRRRDASRSRSRSEPRSSKNASAQMHSDSVEGTSDDEDDEHAKKSSKAPRKRRLRKPRDCSEVMNVALSTGWDARIVERATLRCTSLFGEPAKKPRKDTPTVVLHCPVAQCKRKEDPFAIAWRWREHLKRSHKYSKEDIEEFEASMAS